MRSNYANVELSLGKLEVSRMQTEQQLDNIQNEKLRLETQYTTLQRTESQIVSELTEKYGVGNLDITTGKFTPVSSLFYPINAFWDLRIIFRIV